MTKRCLILLLLIITPAPARADGGMLRFSKVAAGYRITLFTAPAAARAGVVDFSVLVQAADSGAVRLDVPVSVHVHREGDSQHRLGGPAATAAANKLLRAIELDLSEPGRWHVEVVVDGTARADTDLDIGPPLPSWLDLALWIGWPGVVILLFVMHQWRVRRVSAPSPARSAAA